MSNQFNIELGNKIKDLRIKNNLSLEALGKKVNLHHSTVSRYEKGLIQSLDIEKLKEFAKALGTTPSYLMGLNVNEETSETNDSSFFEELRKKKNVTPEEIASELSIPIEDLRAYSKGTKRISYDDMKKLADYFGVNLDTIKAMNVTSEKGKELDVSLRVIEISERWAKEIGHVEFTDEELDKLISYAKFILSERKGQ